MKTIKINKIVIPDKVKYILNILKENGYEGYVVGGAVRDTLLNRTVSDYDVTTNALPLEIKDIFKKHPVIETGIKHGTVTVVIDHEPFEITTYRVEGEYLDNRHPSKVFFTTSLKEDLSRRDFTINALALDINGNVIDYFNGVEDLNKKIVRCVGNPKKRFEEDGLRILRAIRFSAKLDFDIEEETSKAIINSMNLIKNISVERIQKEFNGILISKYTNRLESVLRKYFDLFVLFIPELNDLMINQNNMYHKNNLLFNHTLEVVKNADPDLILRLSALFHDIGKKVCYSEEVLDNGTIKGHFYGHPLESARIAKDIMKRLKYSNNEIDEVTWLIEYHDFEIAETKKSVKRILNKCISFELFDKLLKLKDSDRKDHTNVDYNYIGYVDRIIKIKNEIIAEDSAFSLKHLAIDGNDIISIGLSGKQVGEVLNYVLESVIEEKVENNKESLIKFISNKYIN